MIVTPFDLRDRAEAAVRTEGGDAPGGLSTGYNMAVGDSFTGSIGYGGDRDWVKVWLTAGTYTMTLNGRGTSPLSDPVLRLHDARGDLVSMDDDSGVGLNSKLTINIGQAGFYYLEAGAFGGAHGNYTMSVTSGGTPDTPVYTHAQIANQLTDGYWNATGRQWRAFDADPGDALNVDLSGLTARGRQLATMALSAWEQVTGLRFNANPGSGAVAIRFDDSDSGAYSSSSVGGNVILDSFVNVSTGWLEGSVGYANYAFQTYIHEIGHALGLGHGGNYNGSAQYGYDNHYANDSWQASVMSYFSQSDNTFISASYAYVMTPMIADILAVQKLYGTAQMRTGDTSYGETTNAGGVYGMIAGLLRNPATRNDVTFTILDHGGRDLLDLHSDGSGQQISLWQGTTSSAYGLRGNISIAYGTVIESVRAGWGHDRIEGNAANNMLMAGPGNDTVFGATGDDTLSGGAGNDQLWGGLGNDVYHVDGLDVAHEAAGQGRDIVISWVSHVLDANIEELRLTGPNAVVGHGNALNNRIVGSEFANTLNGWNGNDTLVGGAGQDVFVFTRGQDVVQDFADNVDTIAIHRALWQGTANSVQAVLDLFRDTAAGLSIDFGNGNRLVLAGVHDIEALRDDILLL